MNILGINAYHADSSAAVLVNGKLIAAVEEERFKRIKHWAGFPVDAISYCLDAANLTISDIDCIAINQDSRANFLQRIKFLMTKRPDIGMLVERFRNKRDRSSILETIETAFPNYQVHAELIRVEHHRAHLSSAFHCSPFDDATVVSVDGFGDFSSTVWGVGHGVEIEIQNKIYFPHSLGIFYQALTQYLGFDNYGDEYKVMGLAPYGKPLYLDKMMEIVKLESNGGFNLNLDYFRHHREKIDLKCENNQPHYGKLYSAALAELLGTPRLKDESLTSRHHDIARSIQAMYEKAFFHLLNTLHKQHGTDSLAVAGGCGMNSVANGRIRKNTPYKNVYVQSAAGDAGGALGAALTVWHKNNPSKKKRPMTHAQWGPEYSKQDVEDVISKHADILNSDEYETEYIENFSHLCVKVVKSLTSGGVVGWFQGRLEWGPRALGNRSILGDPRRSDMKDILNLKIKRRESFRPFAPSILREHVADWFEDDDDVPFMMKVFPIKEERRSQIPAVTHVDGSGRLQTVEKVANPPYWQLIETFRKETGIPILLNTSFNENEPIVCRPEEALNCFLRTKMDMLVLGHWLIKRH